MCVRNFTNLGSDFNWYISAMWLMYFLSPFLKEIVDRTDTFMKFVFCLVGMIIFTVSFWNAITYIITISRIPIFLIGMYVGKLSLENVVMRKREMVILLALTIMGLGVLNCFQKFYPDYLWSKGFYWYPFILIVPGMCVCVSLVAEMMKKYLRCLGTIVVKIFEIPGKYSFEIYLIHILFFDILKNNLIPNGIVEDKRAVWETSIALLIPACILLRFISGKVTNLVEKKMS